VLRPRFTLRWLMALIAFVALAVWGWQMWELREKYRSHAARHEHGYLVSAIIGRDLRRNLEDKRRNLEDKGSDFPTDRAIIEMYDRRASYHHQLKLKYERAARYPWLPVEPDPAEPE
jgi:hypothetical protein